MQPDRVNGRDFNRSADVADEPAHAFGKLGVRRQNIFRLAVKNFAGSRQANFAPPARDINVPNTFGLITSTVGTPRVVELALKFYF